MIDVIDVKRSSIRQKHTQIFVTWNLRIALLDGVRVSFDFDIRHLCNTFWIVVWRMPSCKLGRAVDSLWLRTHDNLMDSTPSSEVLVLDNFFFKMLSIHLNRESQCKQIFLSVRGFLPCAHWKFLVNFTIMLTHCFFDWADAILLTAADAILLTAADAILLTCVATQCVSYHCDMLRVLRLKLSKFLIISQQTPWLCN